MGSKITMDDIAKCIGVSKNAVSLALRGMPGISEEMRLNIVNTAKSMGYSYKKASVNTETKMQNICIISSMSVKRSEGFYEYIQYGIEREARNRKVNCMLFHYDEYSNSMEIPICVEERNVSGIICIGTIDKMYYKKLKEYKVPVIMVDYYFDTISCDCILTDNVTGAFEATEYLMKLGHKSIGFFGDVYKAPSFFDRWLGYVKALKNGGLYSMKLLHAKDSQSVLRAVEPPSALLCCNDSSAFTLINDLNAEGIRVPEDISIMGFDNINPLNSTLTTVHVQKEELGIQAFRRLCQVAKNDDEMEHKVLIPVSIVERDSVRKIYSNGTQRV